MKKPASQIKRSSRVASLAPKVPRPSKQPTRPQHTVLPTGPATMATADGLPSYWRKYRWYMLFFFTSIAVFVGCSWLVYKEMLFGKDYYFFRLINDWPEKLSVGFVVLTALGSFWAAAVLVVSAFVLRLYQLAWRLSLSIFTVYGLLLGLKEIFGRARPETVLSDIHIRAVESSFAFPSAHTAVATVLALTLRTYLPIPLIWQWFVVLVWIGGVGLSRAYLGVHTPLDIAAGFALGVGVVCFWRILPTPIKRVLHLK